MHKPSSSATNHDDDDPDLNHSTSTNTALLPPGSGNNGYLWGQHNRTDTDGEGAAPLSTTTSQGGVADGAAGCGNPSNSRSDLVLTELGQGSARVDIRSGSRHDSSGGAVRQKGSNKTKSCWYLWREYRCQIILLVAFIEFAILIAGVTFYSAGVLTATCDNTAATAAGRQGKIYLYLLSIGWIYLWCCRADEFDGERTLKRICWKKTNCIANLECLTIIVTANELNFLLYQIPRNVELLIMIKEGTPPDDGIVN